ncbi:hypothetical protein [Planobispora takensis]|uniref:Uncharacterized protein n=1 Tax=Planobispora takensis TaxID=1367882 RepID=A0A8J3WY36_9ACTN|nr:hypothetical protein [Planobispora takensis]GII05483.1 hypothetical protein Pta02_74910 [Planobispora takensis]
MAQGETVGFITIVFAVGFLYAIVEVMHRFKRPLRSAEPTGFVLGWRTQEGTVHTRTAPVGADDLDLELWAAQLSLEPSVASAWVSRHTPAGMVRRCWVQGQLQEPPIS